MSIGIRRRRAGRNSKTVVRTSRCSLGWRVRFPRQLPTWTTQHCNDLIRRIEKKKIGCAPGQLNNQSANPVTLAAEREPHDAVLRVLLNTDNRGAIRLRAQQLSKMTKRHRRLLQVPRTSLNQIKPRTCRLDTDEQKTPPQPEIERKRQPRQLIDFSEESSA